MAFDSENKIFKLAADFVNYTDKHIFVTGKAGTGKTTFLRYIRNNCSKKMAVVAPTGVAAINAGGVTMHSLFQLPFGLFLPTAQYGWNGTNQAYANFHTLFSNLRINHAKRELFRELELLIIDEVSMVRADMLDATDAVLRHIRGNDEQPFGGVQVLFIGDLFQLPPVVTNDDWEVLQQCYESPFFFDALAVRESPLIYLELQTIYRQNDTDFINLLNNVRNNRPTYADLHRLQTLHQPDFVPVKEDNYITLTSHVAKAEEINDTEFERLEGEVFTFEAEVMGEFNEKSFPADKSLRLKEGAQIMFIKNDKGEARRYYNGKIGIIHSISEEKITVLFPKENETIDVEKEIWKNIRYQYNNESNKLEEEELGEFKQYPIRLAWAITIHKSQGLTFEKAVIDAGASFAPGQVYVSLSRLTSMDGLVLRSRINPQSISTDERVIEFSNDAECDEESLLEILKEEQGKYLFRILIKSFDWTKLKDVFEEHSEEIEHRLIPEKEQALELSKEWLLTVASQKEVADNFIRHLRRLIQNAVDDEYVSLCERINSAAVYFTKELTIAFAEPLQYHIEDVKSKKRISKYAKGLSALLKHVERKVAEINRAIKIVEGMKQGKDVDELLNIAEEKRKASSDSKKEASEKISTKKITLDLYNEGKTPEEIASERGLALGTIESHLLSFVSTGEINIDVFVSEDKLNEIKKVIGELGTDALLSTIKEKMGEDYTYNEIKASLYSMNGQ